MESPVSRDPHKSSASSETQLQLRRYKGIRSSKKSGHSSSSEFYGLRPHPGGVDGDGSNEDEGEEDSSNHLGPRSLSLSALATSGGDGSGVTRFSGSSSKLPGTNRMSQLETLEAKMASIEVSLANVAAVAAQGGSLHPLPGPLPPSHNISTQSSTGGGHRRTKRSLCGSARSQLSAPSSHSSSRNLDRDREQQQLILKECQVLRDSLKDKDNLILNLQGQLRKLSKRRLTHGSITSTDSGVLSLRVLSDSERKGAEERLSTLDRDMDLKRSDISAINVRLARIRLRPSDNIDTRIEAAELEYELEREELNLMNLAEERRNLHTLLDDNDAAAKRSESSLWASLPLNTPPLTIHAFAIDSADGKSQFTLGKRENRPGTYVTWTKEESATGGSGRGGGGLKRGDRIVEINGSLVINKGVNKLEEFWLDEDNNAVAGEGEESHSSGGDEDFTLGGGALRVVVLREPPPPPPPRAPNRELHTLREELSLVTAKLEQVCKEKREAVGVRNQLQSQLEPLLRLRSEGEVTSKERDALRMEGVRLRHRISYLEEQVSELVGEKEGGIHPTVFQKGSQRTLVGSGESSSRPSSVTSASSKKGWSGSGPGPGERESSAAPGQSRSGAFRSRLWETFRRAAALSSSDARSVCSIDSSKAGTEAGYFAKKRGKGSKSRDGCGSAWPPSKPLRLSLQRATSSSEVYSGGGDSHCPGGGGHAHAHSSLDLGRGQGQLNSRPQFEGQCGLNGDEVGGRSKGGKNGKSSRKSGSGGGGIRWPSLRPASSMSYAMPSGNHPPTKY